MAIKIYCFGPMDRSGRVRWLLEEMSISYEDRQLDFHNKEHKGEEYLKINPMGSVPAVDIDGQILVESGAICTYLADKYADKGMAPALDSPHRGLYLQWMFFIPATAEPVLTEGFKALFSPEEEQDKIFNELAKKSSTVIGILANALKGKEYMVNNTFSAVDIMVGGTLNWAKQFKLLNDQPELEAYIEKLKARPAAEKSGFFLPINPGK